MDHSPRLDLPFIHAGQSQKEFFHNEALQLLDTIVAAAVEEGPRNAPPTAPVEGSCFIIGAAPVGVWAGRADAIAAFGAAGWRFVIPHDGLQAWVKTTSNWALYHQGQWELGTLRGSRLIIDGEQVLSSRSAAIADPVGGGNPDSEARLAIQEILSAMRSHGLIATE